MLITSGTTWGAYIRFPYRCFLSSSEKGEMLSRAACRGEEREKKKRKKKQQLSMMGAGGKEATAASL